ncbi:hypothetical protein [Paractinoplanes hotanensis]|uniref:Type II toxin-antitoxin system PemK/MazF family toxin n=1 Tax=Paractinoplanes hotanensis TaxID=2906497 RepID=A0ABT0Y2L9_9ACTN|nr:hypothetical protein [Actinoplanes hotanensis]MCM4079758.1 hypothetical protein [Actinoplanes hotanensis]
MERGEVWRIDLDGPQPVVLLSVHEPGSAVLRAIQVVPPATAEQKRGFSFLDVDELPAEAGTGRGSQITGIEVPIGAPEGLDPAGVVRLALPHEGRIFCTWQVTLAAEHLVERVGTLSSAAMRRLDHALRLAGET